MFTEGESELRDLVVQNLELCGFLNKIKAELRAGVFLALSEEGSLRKEVPLFNKQLDNFISTNDGKLALSIVREFLEYFNLNFTLSVFDPEVSNSNSSSSRKKLCEDLNLNETKVDGPILSALFKTQVTTKLSDLDLNLTKSVEVKDKSKNLVDKSYVNNNFNEKNSLNSSQKSTKQTEDLFNKKRETNQDNKSADISSFSLSKVGNDENFLSFSKPEERDIFKDQSIDNFFDDPVPSEKPNFLTFSNTVELTEQKSLPSTFATSEIGSTSALNVQKKIAFLTSGEESTSVLNDQKRVSATFLSSDKGSLSSLRDLPSLANQDNFKYKEFQAITIESDILVSDSKETFKEDLAKRDPESTEEFSDQQINSEESIEEEFSAGLDDLLNSSLSLGDDATSDQTVSQASGVNGVDHIETCNTVN